MLKKHFPHIDRLEEFEKQFKVPSKDWYRSMQVLISLATLLQKNETSQRLLDAQVQARTPILEPQLSEDAQRMAKLTPLEQQVIREAGEKFRIQLKRKLAEGRAGSVC
jgi:hypothetical protein